MPVKLKTSLSCLLAAVVVASALCWPNAPASATAPVAVVADAPAVAIETKNWLQEASSYLVNKMGTIFFQNIVRKVLNDFAMDAAKYVGSGGKGQEALYVKEKWGNFWQNIGDKAVGDFIETLATTVVVDIAADDKLAESQARCAEQNQTCIENAGGDQARLESCAKQNSRCLAIGGDESEQSAVCQRAYDDCTQRCQKLENASAERCLASCNKAKEGCDSRVGAARKAPMFGNGSPLAKVNICNPDLDVMVQINFGLTQYHTGYNPDCSFSKMVKNWGNAYEKLKDMASADYLYRLANQFDPVSSDLSVAFTLNTNLIEYRNEKVGVSEKETIANQGWLDLRNFAGDLVGTPEESKKTKQLTDEAMWDNFGKVTGDILVDAANIFLNQVAITGWQTLMRSLSSDDEVGGTKLANWSGSSSNRQAIEAKISRLTEPVFSEPGKMNIMTQLASCRDEQNPGPTDCVITSQFADAVNNKMTVMGAVQAGRLNGDWPFGFNRLGEEKLVYNQGYPYRSLVILRKYRIIPVGWELAAQKIQQAYQKNKQSDGKILSAGSSTLPNRPNGVTLNDLLACYSPTDDVPGYSEEWCRGLVDPYWVLKIPDYYCAARGYGPNITQDPRQVDTGNKYCSHDNGKNVTMFDGAERACSIDNDCCTEDELATKDKLIKNGDTKRANSFKCLSNCSYKEKELAVYRNNDYCADEQSCIKTGDNGSCRFYGYCLEESRKWTFSHSKQDKVCAPQANSCSKFRDTKGKTKYLLADTLDFSICNADNVGCSSYARSGAYDQATDKLAWNNERTINFNAKVQGCRNSEQGCHEFIRLIDGNGSNVIADGGFEGADFKRWEKYGELAVAAENDDKVKVAAGVASLHVAAGKPGISYDAAKDKSLLPSGFEFEVGRTYTLSASVYTVSGAVEMGIGKAGQAASYQIIDSKQTGAWENFYLTIFNDFDVALDNFYIRASGGGAEFYVDNLKLEIGPATNYTDYRGDNLAYLKAMPSYLESLCYNNPPSDYSLKPEAPAICSKFARRCNKSEVGCQLFTDVRTKDQVAAKVKPKDYCPGECIGFDSFIQRANDFYSAKQAHFIPNTAKSCRPQAVGCSLFVNLDKVKEGGESDEYYAALRQCIKPEADKCGEFITWEGSAESGWQLKVSRLQLNTDGEYDQPATINDDNALDYVDGQVCNEYIYSLPPSDPSYNPDCRQFYAKDGSVSYHLYNKTVSCSDNCHPYRIVEPNVEEKYNSQGYCENNKGHWLADKSQCVVCQGGTWSDDHQTCVYMAIPGEGTTCGKQEVGCSEYVGNFANKVKIIINDTFEAGVSSWEDGANNSPLVEAESLVQGGHSLRSKSNSVNKKVLGQIQAGKKYELTFLAKTKNPNAYISSIHVSRANQFSEELTFVSDLRLSADWRLYRFAITNTGQTDIDQLSFVFNSDNNSGENIYLDNIKLVESDDRYYLIKNSWQTPEVCNQDHQGNPFPLYMLGCRQYSDQNNKLHNLKSFDGLCQLSGVGCEAMIDTQNSSYHGQQVFMDDNKNGSCDAAESGCVSVPADEVVYMVYDNKKTCSAENKGCERFGLYDNDLERYKDTYVKNDPDRYREILCASSAVGCTAWLQDDNSQVYFKDPGQKVCEYRQRKDSGVYGWLRKKVARCGGVSSGALCADDADCGSEKCALDESDIDCSVDTEAGKTHKTVGLGIINEKAQPVGMNIAAGGDGYAGGCYQSEAGCTEYIDPESRINYNLAVRQQTGQVALAANKLHILKAGAGTASLSCSAGTIYRLNDKNNLESAGSRVEAVAGYTEEFYVFDVANQGESVSCTMAGDVAELKEAIVAYRIKKSVDRERPSMVDFNKGAILFNERSWNAGKPQNLVYSTSKSLSGQLPQATDVLPPGNNANQLLQVEPDRECSKWLGCRSYGVNPLDKTGKSKMCYERGVCDQLNEAGECVHFIDAPTGDNQTYPAVAAKVDINNASGYSKVGQDGNLWTADLYHLAAMKEQGDTKVKFDGSFETGFVSGFWVSGTEDGKPANAALILRDAAIIEREMGYGSYKTVPDGNSIAKISSGCVYKDIEDVAGSDYIASAYVFVKTGNRASLSIGRSDGGSACPILKEDGSPYACNSNGQAVNYDIVASTEQAGDWVRISGRFRLADNYQTGKLRLSICSNGVTYFDDVRLEPALKARSDKYLHPSCRLFPESGSLSCNYFRDDGVRKKGWEGYCLEYDPRNPQACLLWYPLDKVAGEEFEEGAAIEVAGDLYYCLDAEDQCSADNPVQPEFYCKKFVKVKTNSHWHSRISPGSAYVIPNNLLRSDGKQPFIDMGVESDKKLGGTSTIAFSQGLGSGFYGAYINKNGLANNKATFLLLGGANSKQVLPFAAYSGMSRAGAGGKDRAYFCMATIAQDGSDRPIELTEGRNSGHKFTESLGTYDNCYVGVATQWDDCADKTNGRDLCCPGWRSNSRAKGSNCSVRDHWLDATADYKREVKKGGDWLCGGNDQADYICRTYADGQKPGNWLGYAEDNCSDSDSIGCFFDCYNHTKAYYGATNASTALEAIKRLFLKTDGCYQWYPGQGYVNNCNENYNIQDTLPACSGPRNNTTLCYFRPKIANFKANLETVGNQYVVRAAAWAQLTFNSDVDEEQLPLIGYTVWWGYKGASGQEWQLTRSANMYDRPNETDPHSVLHFYDYSFLSRYNTASCSVDGQAGVAVRPRVKITDNWGKYEETTLDKPICVLPN